MFKSLGNAALLGMGAGSFVSSKFIKPKTQKGEHRINNVKTAVGLGVATVSPSIVNKIAKKNPKLVNKVADLLGKGIESATKFVNDKGPKLLEKLNSTKLGSKLVNVTSNLSKKFVNLLSKNNFAKKLLNKSSKALKKFAKASTNQKGKYALVAAGFGLLALGVVKMIRNHDRKSGAIDQKYSELRVKYETMLQSRKPIMDARTGKPITFDQYCVCAQTYLK